MTHAKFGSVSMRSGIGRFFASEDGVSTVEMIFWVPLVTIFMVFIANATMVLQTQTLMFDAARDMARSVATNTATAAEAQARLEARFGDRMRVSGSVSQDAGFVTATVRAEFQGIVSWLGNFLGEADMVASVTMWQEPANAA